MLISPAPKQGERYEISQEKRADDAARADAEERHGFSHRTPQKFPEEKTAKLKVDAITTMAIYSAWAS
jgi:hypothetical protein